MEKITGNYEWNNAKTCEHNYPSLSKDVAAKKLA